MGDHSSKPELYPQNMENTLDDQKYMLYGCGNKLWVSLLGLWGVVNYSPILVCRQYAAEKFTPATSSLSQLEFAYGDPRYTA